MIERFIPSLPANPTQAPIALPARPAEERADDELDLPINYSSRAVHPKRRADCE